MAVQRSAKSGSTRARTRQVKGVPEANTISGRAEPDEGGVVDDMPADPIDTALGHSTPLLPVLVMRWPDSDLPYLAPNVSLAFCGAALRANDAGDVSATDVIAAALALPLIRSGAWTTGVHQRLADLGGAPQTYFDPASLKQWRDSPKARSVKRFANRILGWDAVALLAEASKLRRETNTSHPQIGLRHICVAALFVREGHEALEKLGLLGQGLGAVADLLGQQVFSKTRRYGDKLKAWEEVFARARSQRLLIAPRPRSGFDADTVGDESDEIEDEGRAPPPDPLGSRADARALADLVLLESARPPLAIGLFGSWGSGKSTLMYRMRKEVRRQIREEQAGTTPPNPDPDTRRVANVAQLEFNAWSFADSKNLWASLTAEIFEQLKAGGSDKLRGTRGTALVSEVAEKLAMHEEQAAAAPSPEGIQKQLDRLETKARNKNIEAEATQLHAVPIAKLVTGNSDAFENRLKKALPGDKDGIAMDAHGTGIGRSWWLAKRMYPGWLLWAPIVAALAFAAGVAALIFLPGLDLVWGVVTTAAAPLLTTIVLVGKPILGALRMAARYDELVHLRKAKLAQEAAALQSEVEAKRTELLRAREDERKRAATVATLAETKGHPARLLQYLLSESADIQSIKAQVGLLATVRRCFETLNELIQQHQLLARAEAARAKGKPRKRRKKEEPPIERIILYIDDLDRCSAEQVVHVLEAVHLLLAFKCFVVIVAIDARWLRRSLVLKHEQFEKGSWDTEDDYGHPSPTDYLEKIFQIPFWVRPLAGSGAYGSYLDQLVGPAGATEEKTGEAEDEARQEHAGGGAARGFEPVPPPRPDVDERSRVERVKFSDAERKMLQELGPLAAKSPRAVKRLINIYRLIRASLSQEQEVAFLGGEPGDVPHYGYVLFALALDAGLEAESVADVRDAITRFSVATWLKLLDAPENFLGPALPPRALSVRDNQVLEALKAPLVAAGRLHGFIAALTALRNSGTGLVDWDEIDRAFAFTQRYSFRAPWSPRGFAAAPDRASR